VVDAEWIVLGVLLFGVGFLLACSVVALISDYRRDD